MNAQTRVLVQGITGRVGRNQTRWMLDAGTPIVAGVTPGRGGHRVHGVPVYDTVAEAVNEQAVNASVAFVPPAAVKLAVTEALQAGVGLEVVVTEHIPVHDVLAIKARAEWTHARIVGPNSPGIFVPSVGKMGIMPASLFAEGCVGVVGRSATLVYEVVANLTSSGWGQTAAVGIGGDMVPCTSFVEVLRMFEADVETQAAVMVGEIGGSAEEQAAEYIAQMQKPVIAYIAGRALPPGRRFGHAGAIIRSSDGGAEAKRRALSRAGAIVVDTPGEIPAAVGRECSVG